MGKNDVDIIKERLSIKDVISSYVRLAPAGKSLKGLCPFHQEKTPSFVVSPDRGMWYCFGCGEGGDLIKFVQLYENMDFPEAMRYLAEKAGVEIKIMKSRDQRQVNVLYEINEAAKDFFKENLIKNKKALEYLHERGLKKNTIKEFELGFCPEGDSLTVKLTKSGFRIQDIIKTGLSLKKGGLNKDRFGSRIMFPIINELGKTVAFTGRVFPPEKEGEFMPKYINSPETLVYKKSKILYGLNKTKTEIVSKKTVFLVEGQMDFLMLWQSEIKNVVAVSGTGLTKDHLDKLRRLADTVVVSFDNDQGGIKALERALDLFGGYDFQIKAVDLGEFNDPAEAIQADPDSFISSANNAKPAMKRLFEHYFKKDMSDMAEKKNTIRHLLSKIGGFKSAVDQDTWLKELAEYSGVSHHALQSEFQDLAIQKKRRKHNSEGEKKSDRLKNFNKRIDKISYRLLVLGFTHDDFFSILKENREWFPRLFRGVIDNPERKDAAILELEAGVEIDRLGKEKIKEEVSDLLRHLKIEAISGKQRKLREEMRNESDEDTINKIASELHRLAVEADRLKNNK